MVTNSHCTNIQGGVQGTVYHQPIASGTTNRIGLEIRDPAYFTGGVLPGRPAVPLQRQRLCPRAPPLGPLGRGQPGVHRPPDGCEYRRPHHQPHHPQVPDRRQKPSSPIVGQTLNKVGRTTGWTRGTVSATCVNTNVFGTNITQLCQGFVNAGVAGGDSGSPVFRVTNAPASGDVSLYGILWGGTSAGTLFVFSPIGSVNSASNGPPSSGR